MPVTAAAHRCMQLFCRWSCSIVSAENNFLNKDGIKTCHILKADSTFTVKYIQGEVPIPGVFDRVTTITKKGDSVEIASFSEKIVFIEVDTGFLID